MDNSAKRYFQYYGAPVLCAAYVILSFCLPQIAGIILGAIALFFLMKTSFRKNHVPLMWFDLAVAVLLFGEFILSVNQSKGLYPKTYLFSLVCNMLVYYTIRFFLRKERQVQLFTNILAGFVALLSALTVLSFLFFKFNIEYEGFTDLVSFKALFQPLGVLLNDWSTILLFSSVFLLVALKWAQVKSAWFWILIVGCGLLAMALLVSFSRGIYISVLLGFIAFIVISIVSRACHIRKLLLVVACSVGLGFLAVLPVLNGVKTTAGFSVTTSQVRSTESRINIAGTAIELFKEHPLAGVGAGNFSLYANPRLALREDSFYTGKATNSYLQLLVEKGIVGFLLWGVFVGILLLAVLRQVKTEKKERFVFSIVFSVLIAILFREVTFSTFFSKSQMQILFFVLAAWIVNRDVGRTIFHPRLNKLLLAYILLFFIVLSGFQFLYSLSYRNNNLFLKKFQEEDLSGAEIAIDRALRVDPNSPALLANKGILQYYIHQNDGLKDPSLLRDALDSYKNAVIVSPNDPYLHHNLAYLYFINGELINADKHFEKACKLSDNTALFHVSKGILLEENGKTNEALNEYKNAIRLSPDILDSEFGKSLEFERNDVLSQMVIDIVDSLSKKIESKDSPILKSRLAKIVLYQKDTVRSGYLLDQVSSQLPNLDRVWYQLGMIKLAQNDTSTFLHYLNRAILLDGRDYLYPKAMSDYFYETGHERDAELYLKNAQTNHINISTLHSITAVRWYGYKTLVNDVLPKDRIVYIKPFFILKSQTIN